MSSEPPFRPILRRQDTEGVDGWAEDYKHCIICGSEFKEDSEVWAIDCRRIPYERGKPIHPETIEERLRKARGKEVKKTPTKALEFIYFQPRGEQDIQQICESCRLEYFSDLPCYDLDDKRMY